MLWLDAVPLPLTGIAASLLAGMATGIGALPVIFIRNVSQKVQDAMLGFGAGVMLAATSFSLIIPAMESAGGKADGAFIVAAGIVLGGLFLWAGDTYLPHEPGNYRLRGRQTWGSFLPIGAKAVGERFPENGGRRIFFVKTSIYEPEGGKIRLTE